jgi:replication initiation protein RepC
MRFAQIRQNVPSFQVRKRTVVLPGHFRTAAPTNLRGKTMHQITFTKSKNRQQVASPDNRWTTLNAVQSAMESLGLRDRDITVLRGLLTFILPNKWTEKLMVYASNASLQARCDGIDERTLRRRLAHLCEVGLIVRHQSPNRKRYVVRGMQGEPVLSYGFDLSPLRDNLNRIQAIGEEQRASVLRVKMLKAVLRDRLHKLAEASFRPETDDLNVEALKKMLRRKTDVATLESAIKAVECCLPTKLEAIEFSQQSTDLSDNLGQTDRHIQSSNKECIEETSPAYKTVKAEVYIDVADLTLAECIEAARSAMEFAQEPPRTWADVTKLASQLAPAIGVQAGQLLRTRETLGERGASLAILGLVEAFARIKEPCRYLNALVTKASQSGLNVARMFRSLTAATRFPAGNQYSTPI